MFTSQVDFFLFLKFSHFHSPREAADYASLKTVLDEALSVHNESNAVMNLVLFDDAISHVTRLMRIIEKPAGNALLVWVIYGQFMTLFGLYIYYGAEVW